MIIDCAHYLRREPPARRRHLARGGGRAQRRRAGSSGSGCSSREPEELEQVRESFGLHELAVEDAQTFHLRPKFEQYDDGRFVILRTAHYVDEREEVEFGEISMFLGPRLCDHGAARRGERTPRRAPPPRAAPELLRAGTDSGARGRSSTRSSTTTRRSSRASSATSRRSRGPSSRARLRADGADLLPPPRGHRLLPRRPPAAGTARCDSSGARSGADRRGSSRTSGTFTTTCGWSNEEIAAQRDLLTTVLEANMAVISVDRRRIASVSRTRWRQLTLVATVFLPLSFVTGSSARTSAGWWTTSTRSLPSCCSGLEGSLVPIALLYLWFRRSGHLAGRGTG